MGSPGLCNEFGSWMLLGTGNLGWSVGFSTIDIGAGHPTKLKVKGI